jgi:hypothetical protein
MPTSVSALDQDRVDDRERSSRERGASDQGRLQRPVEQEERNERGDDERAGERGDPDPDRRLKSAAHVTGIDLHSGQEREHDRGERGNEVEPLLARKIEHISGDDAQGELEQRHGHAELDREHARDENDYCENGGELNRLHVDLHLAST